jgi:hypothetical protein
VTFFHALKFLEVPTTIEDVVEHVNLILRAFFVNKHVSLKTCKTQYTKQYMKSK